MVIAGCSSKPDIHTTADNVCDEVAAALCYDMSQCCGGDQLAQLLGSGASCHAVIAQRCTAAMAPDRFSLAKGNVVFDGTRMDACLDELEMDDSCMANGPPWAEVCAISPWLGTVAPGGTCNNPHECATGTSCLGQICQDAGQIDAPCQTSLECDLGLVCDGNVCSPPAPNGGICGSDAGCLSGHCVPGTCSESGMACYLRCDFCAISKIPCDQGCPQNDTCASESCDNNACAAATLDYCTGPIHALGLDH